MIWLPTLGRILGAVRHRLAGVGVYEDDSTELTQPLSESDLVMRVDSVQGATRGVFEVGLELVRAKAVDVASSTITLPSFGRGYKGTTVSAHPAGSEVIANPMWPASAVAAEINGVLHELYPSLYAVRSFEGTLVAGVPFTVPAECTGIIAVFVSYGTADGWVRQDSWRWEPDAGQGLRVDHARPGGAIRVVYAARPGTFVLDEGQRISRNLQLNPRAAGRAWVTAGAAGTSTEETVGGPFGFGYQKFVLGTPTTTSPINLQPTPNGTSSTPVVAGRTYTFSAHLYCSWASAALLTQAAVNFYTASGANLSQVNNYTANNGTPGWQEFSRTLVAPPGAAYAVTVAAFSAGAGTIPLGTEFGVTAFKTSETDTATFYSDGAYAPPGYSPSWDGGVAGGSSTVVPTSSVLDYDFKTVTGLDDRAVDLLTLGVAYRLAPFADMARLSATGAEPRNDPQSKPPQSGAQASRLLLAEFTQRLQQEQAVLHKEHPIRVHRVKR